MPKKHRDEHVTIAVISEGVAVLAQFLSQIISFEQIANNIRAKKLQALAVTATNYTNATSITFVQAAGEVGMWTRSRRRSERANIQCEHVMASSAIPLFFPPVEINKKHYGDGCVRNMAPLAPAIHLGADRLLVISVRRPDIRAAPTDESIEPSFARVLGVILNALLLDSIDIDMERMSRINSTLEYVPSRQRSDLRLRKVDYLWIRPSHDIADLAGQLFHHLPPVIRYLLSGLGSEKEAEELTSYLLFDSDYCSQLVQLGYVDTMASRDAISQFLTM